MGFGKSNCDMVKDYPNQLVVDLLKLIGLLIIALQGLVEQSDKLHQTVFIH